MVPAMMAVFTVLAMFVLFPDRLRGGRLMDDFCSLRRTGDGEHEHDT